MNSIRDKVKLMHMTQVSYLPGNDDSVELANPSSRKRVKIDKDSLLKLILQMENNQDVDSSVKEVLDNYGFLCDPSMERIEDDEHIKRWEHNNWEFSLHYYFWSRETPFVDKGKTYNEIRKSVLEDYLKKEELPKPHKIKSTSKKIYLPQLSNCESTSKLGEVLLRRTTVQNFKDEPMKFSLFNQVIFSAFKELRDELSYIDYEEDVLNLLTGWGYPFIIHLLIFNVDDLEPGLYSYNVKDHALELVNKGDFRLTLEKVLIGQSASLTSSFAALLSVDYQQKQWRYRHEKELRNTYIVVAQLCQRLILSATDKKVFCNLTPASVDKLASNLLGLDDKKEQLLYTINVGQK